MKNFKLYQLRSCGWCWYGTYSGPRDELLAKLNWYVATALESNISIKIETNVEESETK